MDDLIACNVVIARNGKERVIKTFPYCNTDCIELFTRAANKGRAVCITCPGQGLIVADTPAYYSHRP